MRLGELLRAEAVTEGGDALGQVHDVRLRLEHTDDKELALVVEGIIVGPGARTARLGYAFGEVTGPWIVSALLRRLSRSARYIPWEQVVELGAGAVRVAASPADLGHPSDAQQQAT